MEHAAIFQILPGLPAYGDLPKLFTATGSTTRREGFVVRFSPHDGMPWVGNFQPGLTCLDAVHLHPDGRNVLVIAGGLVYVVDPNDGNILDIFGGQFDACHFLSAKNELLLTSDLWLELVGHAGLRWRTRRLSWDGLRNIRVTASEASGEAEHHDGSWHPFSVDLSTGITTGGAYDGPNP